MPEPAVETTVETPAAAPEGYFTAEQVDARIAGLAKKNEQLLREKKALEGKGVDLAEFEQLRAEKAKREQEEAERKGEYQRLLQHTKAESERLIAAEKDRASKLEQELNDGTKRTEAIAALTPPTSQDSPKRKAVSPELLLPHVLEVTEVVIENGRRVTRVKDLKDGGFRFGKNGEYMTVDEYVQTELVKRFPSAFEGHQASGSGAIGKVGGAGANGKELNHLPPDERLTRAFESGAQRR